MIDASHPQPGRVVVLAGPTAVGKGTVSRRLLERFPDVHLSVSATTRPPRPGEREGVHYYFVTPERFRELEADGSFLEWAVVHNAHRYGTLREPVERASADGHPVLLEIDLAGARQIRSSMPEAHFVFLAPPSFDDLVHRLIGRGTEDEAERQRRLDTAREELAAQSEFDVTIVNDDVDTAVDALARELGVL